MMLPSGNDAAQSLAIYFGNLIQIAQMKQGKVLFGKNKNNIGQIDANLDEENYNLEQMELDEKEQLEFELEQERQEQNQSYNNSDNNRESEEKQKESDNNFQKQEYSTS